RSALNLGSIPSGPHDLLEMDDAGHQAGQSRSGLIRECFVPTTPTRRRGLPGREVAGSPGVLPYLALTRTTGILGKSTRMLAQIAVIARTPFSTLRFLRAPSDPPHRPGNCSNLSSFRGLFDPRASPGAAGEGSHNSQ